jgi:CRP-like cAMP-binding protein
LAALPPAEYARVIDQSRLASFDLGDIIYAPDAALDFVYFPRSGIFSLLHTMIDGRAAEVTMLGAEGMFGVATILGGKTSSTKVICQLPADAVRMPTKVFLAEIERSPMLKRFVHAFARFNLDCVARLSACNALHSVDQRCARWILMSRDRAPGDAFPLTQEFMAIMLGVRRSSISVSASKLQEEGLIAYRHGRMMILDRRKLENAACECYSAIHTLASRMYSED